MTQPNLACITLAPTRDEIAELIQDLFIHPRILLLKWSTRTNQTAQVRIAYPGQHLASLVTGVSGSGSAARGDDLADGSEVKTCSRADQLGRCKGTDCGQRVLPSQKNCPVCGSMAIERKKDSHWILSMRSETERDQYLECDRVILVLFDRPEDGEPIIRIRMWEIWPKSDRHTYFRWFIEDYWTNNYLEKINRNLNPAPLNLHPLKFDFHMMNPILIFEARVDVDDEELPIRDREVKILRWEEPGIDRVNIAAEEMPATVVNRSVLAGLVPTLTDQALADCLETTAHEAGLLRSEKSIRAIVDSMVCIPESVQSLLPLPSKSLKMTPSTYRRGR